MHATECRRARSPWQAEFLIEAGLLAAFMVSALAFTILLEHPASPLCSIAEPPVVRRLVIGLGMGATAVLLIYSPWGRRSGAHMNPAATLALFRVGLVPRCSAAGYIVAQLIGAAAGVGLGQWVFGPLVAHPAVGFMVTRPGAWGAGAAFIGEVAMTAAQMGVVLAMSARPALRAHAGLAAAALVALFITIEAPISGMSLNPARTLGSAVWAGEYQSLWVYLSAPVLGMWLAAERHRRQHPVNEEGS
jgi:aquaporin Z